MSNRFLGIIQGWCNEHHYTYYSERCKLDPASITSTRNHFVGVRGKAKGIPDNSQSNGDAISLLSLPVSGLSFMEPILAFWRRGIVSEWHVVLSLLEEVPDYCKLRIACSHNELGQPKPLIKFVLKHCRRVLSQVNQV